MARDIEHVVGASQDPDVAVFVNPCAVASKVHARDLAEVRLDEPLVVLVHAAHHARPGGINGKEAALVDAHIVALHVHHAWVDAKERARGTARLGGCGAWEGCKHHAASLRLPPGVHDGQRLLADHTMVPLPRLGVDGLSHSTQDADTETRNA